MNKMARVKRILSSDTSIGKHAVKCKTFKMGEDRGKKERKKKNKDNPAFQKIKRIENRRVP